MGAVTQVASAILLALVPPHGEPKQEARSTTGNEVVRRATITSTSELKAFLRMNPEEGFDIEAINAVDTHALLKDARVEKELLLATVRNAEALLPRVRAETEDPLLVGAILSDKTLAWYRKSTADPDWTEFAPIRWGGIFFESRAPGGRLRRKLSTRLVDLINDCVNAAGTTAVLRAGFSGMLRGSKHMKNAVQYALGSKRPRLTQQVAQAYLDDLAANPRGGDTPVPLAHLSDVAKRMGTAEVNNTLAELFHAQSNRVLIVLDPRFHPGMNSVFIQVVPPRIPRNLPLTTSSRSNRANPARAPRRPKPRRSRHPRRPGTRRTSRTRTGSSSSRPSRRRREGSRRPLRRTTAIDPGTSSCAISCSGTRPRARPSWSSTGKGAPVGSRSSRNSSPSGRGPPRWTRTPTI